MYDFLLDTNIWDYWFDEDCSQHKSILRRVGNLIKTFEQRGVPRFSVSAITWGEIEYGYRVRRDEYRSFEKEFRRFVQDKSTIVYHIDKHVTAAYGEIRAKLFEKFSSKQKKNGKMRLAQLRDPVTDLELGIDENDLWIAAQAMTYKLTLVTNDKLTRIREVTCEELHIENWAED